MELIKSYIRTIIILIIISFLSLMNVNKITPSGIHFFKNFDKLVHFLMYFTLCLVFLLENHTHKFHLKKRWVVLDTIFVGIIFELLQFALTKTRSGNIYDALFNILGICSATCVFQLVKKRRFIYNLLFIKDPYTR